jgi:hypothetical protein
MKLIRALGLTLTLALPAAAQSPVSSRQNSPIMDMVEKGKDALNNLQYMTARATARELLALKLKRSQEIAALQLASAAYYPDELSARKPDTAAIYLRRLARLMPIGGFPSDLVSPALDSQLALARRNTFGATARPPLQVTLKGTDMRPAIEVIATRPARWQLFLSSGDGAPRILLDTLGASTNGRLSLRAHNGVDPLIMPGDQRLKVVSIASGQPDTIEISFDASATGAMPSLIAPPAAPDATKFLPEKANRAIGAGVAGAIIVGGATWALSNVLRPSGSLGDQKKDGRATFVAVGISVGALAAGLLDRGRPLPENIKANNAVRNSYLKQLGDATDTNRKRVAEYSLVLTIDPEIR